MSKLRPIRVCGVNEELIIARAAAAVLVGRGEDDTSTRAGVVRRNVEQLLMKEPREMITTAMGSHKCTLIVVSWILPQSLKSKHQSQAIQS
jgi:hypothetical protein